MKKRILLLALAVLMVLPGGALAAEEKYEVPVFLAHQSGEPGKPSMGNPSLKPLVTVERQGDDYVYRLKLKPIEFMSMTGQVINFFVYEGDKDGPKAPATKTAISEGEYITEYSFKRPVKGEEKIWVAVWVDAMDAIAGGNPGDGKQNAILELDWDKAVTLVGPKEDPQPQPQPQPKPQPQEPGQTGRFMDVADSHWGKDAIQYVTAKGYFQGTGPNTFEPGSSITRGQFITVLGRMSGVKAEDYQKLPFTDVKPGDYFAPYVAWGQENGIVTGEGSTYSPNRALSRQEMAVIMDRFLDHTGKSLKAKDFKGFPDIDQVADWAKDSVKKMAGFGVVSGMDGGTFAPQEDFTRAQTAQVLFNIDMN